MVLIPTATLPGTELNHAEDRSERFYVAALSQTHSGSRALEIEGCLHVPTIEESRTDTQIDG